MLRFMQSVLRDETGATAIEYSLLAALIAVAIIGGVSFVGSKMNTTYSGIASNLK